MNSCGLGALGGRADHLRVGGVGPAVDDVVAHRAVQQRGVLRHHADLRAQAVLRHVRDVLAVDQDAAALEVVEAQQQVDERRLARARAADQADLLARPDGQRRGRRSRGAAAAVGESSRARSAPRRAAPRAASASGASTTARGRDSVLMPSCTVPMFSNRLGHLPHDPVRDAVAGAAPSRSPRRPRRRRPAPCVHSHSAMPAVPAIRPMLQRVVDDLEGAHQPHLAVAGDHELLHRRAREAGLALRVREQLDGGDVGVGVGDAAGHQRARVGLRLADLAQARHEVAAARRRRAASQARKGSSSQQVEAAGHARSSSRSR